MRVRSGINRKRRVGPSSPRPAPGAGKKLVVGYSQIGAEALADGQLRLIRPKRRRSGIECVWRRPQKRRTRSRRCAVQVQKSKDMFSPVVATVDPGAQGDQQANLR